MLGVWRTGSLYQNHRGLPPKAEAAVLLRRATLLPPHWLPSRPVPPPPTCSTYTWCSGSRKVWAIQVFKDRERLCVQNCQEKTPRPERLAPEIYFYNCVILATSEHLVVVKWTVTSLFRSLNSKDI